MCQGWLGCVVVVVVMGCGRRDFNDVAVDAPIDALACTEPPAGCVEPVVYECGGTCYAKCRQLLSRAAAAAACAEWGGCLAVAHNQAANDCAGSQLAGDTVYIGYQQRMTATQQAMGWQWCDGTPTTFTSWRPGQPDDNNSPENGEQNCAVLNPDGAWEDRSCAMLEKFVCSR